VSDNQSFFSRWSQRKAETKTNPESSTLEEELSAKQQTEALSDSIEDQEETPVLTDEDMPDIESLDDESDFKQFFSPGVSEELRNLALRKMFRLPEFNIRDGLNDYDEDFSKMPELTQAVVSKLRNWVEEEIEETQEQLKEQLTDSDDSDLSTESSSEEQEQKDTKPDYSDLEDDDDLGDADLDG